MGSKGSIILIGVVLTSGVLAAPWPFVDAAIIPTASLDTVIASSTHIVLVRYEADKGFVPLTWYRGEPRKGPLAIQGIPSVLFFPLRFGTFQAGRKRAALPLDRIVLFLEEHHGRLHVTSYRRRGSGFGGHSSVRVISRKGLVFRFSQITNPGSPAPVRATPADFAKFEAHLKKQVRSLPYKPVSHPVKLPPITSKERDELLSLIGDSVDLYQGRWHLNWAGWHGQSPDTAGIVKLARALGKHIETTESRAAALHALDAMMLLSTKTSAGWEHQEAVRKEALRALPHVDPVQARTWILDEIEYGRYGTDFTCLGRMAKALGGEVYERAIRILESWVERTEVNKGTGAYWALVYLGHKDRAEKAVARREGRPLKDPQKK